MATWPAKSNLGLWDSPGTSLTSASELAEVKEIPDNNQNVTLI